MATLSPCIPRHVARRGLSAALATRTRRIAHASRRRPAGSARLGLDRRRQPPRRCCVGPDQDHRRPFPAQPDGQPASALPVDRHDDDLPRQIHLGILATGNADLPSRVYNVAMAAPPPIDPRGPRFNQAVLAIALLGGFLLDWRVIVPVFAVVLL